LAIVFLAAEVVLRIFYPQPDLPVWSPESLEIIQDNQRAFFEKTFRDGLWRLVQVPRKNAYTPPQEFLFDKPAGSARILVVGESSSVSLGRSLRQLLELAGLPDIAEVMNCGSPAGTLEDVGRRLDESLRYSPDVVVLLFGHNVFYRAPSLNSLSFRIGAFAGGSRIVRWILHAKMEQAINDPERWGEFEDFLRRSVRRARRRNVAIVLCTVPSNLWYPPGVAGWELYDARFMEAGYLHLSGKRREAIALLEDLVARRSTALWHFQLADWQHEEGNDRRALDHLTEALNLDPEIFRATDRTNAIIRRVAIESGVGLLDIEARLKKAVPDGIPGWLDFEDNQHLVGSGTRWAASSLTGLFVQQGRFPADTRRIWEAYSERYARDEIFPLERYLRGAAFWAQRMENANARAIPYKVAAAYRENPREVLRVSRALLGRDWWAAEVLPRWRAILLLQVSEGLWRAGERDLSFRLAARAAEWDDAWEEPLLQMGKCHLRLGNRDEARRCFERARRRNHERVEVAFFLRRLRSEANGS